jgi:glycosidase
MLCTFSLSSYAKDYAIQHLEPASWWVGMQDRKLQLLVHGEDIADLSASINYPGVTVTDVIKVANKNYLFINLTIAPETAAGKFTLQFQHHGKTVLSADYPLQARGTNSAQRPGFSPSDVIYLIVPDRFANGDSKNDSISTLKDKANRSNPSARHGGDLAGMNARLDYVANMGFTMIWPTPLIENDQPAYSYHGYGATNHYKIDPRFGSNEDYRQFVAKAKTKGLGVIQDIVLNHIGSGHWWMKDLPSADWLNYQGKPVFTNHARTTLQDSHASAADRKVFSDGWFSENMPDLNQRNPLVATYLIQNSIWWTEYANLSGIRTDTYSYSDKAFLANWSARLLQEYPNFNMVGEEWSANPNIVSYWQKGKINHDGYVSSMPSMMDFPGYEALRQGLVEAETYNGGLNKLYENIANDFLYPNADNLVIFEGNHDTSRLFSALNDDIDLYKMAMVYLATMRGIPQITYGTEILMSSPKQRDDGKVRSDMPGGWQGDRNSAFTGAGLSTKQSEAQDFLKRLLNWRKNSPVVQTGKLMHFAPDKGTYVYVRYDDKNKVMVAMNKNKEAVNLKTSRFHEMLTPTASATEVLTGKKFNLSHAIELPARSVLILSID